MILTFLGYHHGLGLRTQMCTYIICSPQIAIWRWQQLSKFAFVLKMTRKEVCACVDVLSVH